MNSIIQKIKDTIKDTKFEGNTYIAGGFVRDYVMGVQSKDIDIVVSNNGMDGGIELAYHLHRMHNTPTPVVFKRFGTAQVVLDGEKIEIVATRKETYNFKDRNPEVEFGTIEDDVKRRDFTINALLWDISNDKLIDLVNGRADISKRRIVTTGDPDIIFAEDPLRIMRAIRFASRLNFKIGRDTDKAIKRYTPWLKNISNERIRDEFTKILISDDPVGGLNRLKYAGILEYMIPEFKDLYKINNQGKHHVKDAWNHTLDVVARSKPTVEARLAALLHDIGKAYTMTVAEDGNIHFHAHQYVSRKIAKRFMIKYKYTNEQIELVGNAVFMHMNFIERMLNKTIRRFVNEMGRETFLFCLDLAEADSWHRARLAIVNNVREFVLTDTFVLNPKTSMPVNGDMIMERFNIKPGKEVGRLLAIEKDFLFEFPEASIEEIWEVIETAIN